MVLAGAMGGAPVVVNGFIIVNVGKVCVSGKDGNRCAKDVVLAVV